MSDYEDFGEELEPVEGEVVPAVPEQPRWAKTLAWTILILGGVYMLNPTFGVDILPDNLPIIGNLDEMTIVLMMLGSLNYLGIQLPEFISRWLTPVRPLLPAPRKPDENDQP